MALRGVREVAQALARVDSRADGQALDQTVRASTVILGFAAAMSGLAAENMVRGGGRMFLDSAGGWSAPRRSPSCSPRCWLFPAPSATPARGARPATRAGTVRPTITYRGRYLKVVQPAPVLDLVLADEGNPRGLAYQLVAAEALLGEIAGGTPRAGGDRARSGRSGAAHGRRRRRRVRPGGCGGRAAERLAALGEAVGGLSDDISRRYFALVRSTRTDAMSETIGAEAGGAEASG